jgi:hypothetical protein
MGDNPLGTAKHCAVNQDLNHRRDLSPPFHHPPRLQQKAAVGVDWFQVDPVELADGTELPANVLVGSRALAGFRHERPLPGPRVSRRSRL